MENELSYRQRADLAIRNALLEFECQPILFVGSGIPRRYFGAPNWRELLKAIFAKLPGGVDNYEYHRQKLSDDPVKIGTALADILFEWAWNEGKSNFPGEFFSSNVSKDIFLKYSISIYIKEISSSLDHISDSLKKEIIAFADIRPHAIITTNYDLFLETVFEGYETITGQRILRYNTNSFGEVFHIHGDVSDLNSLVLTEKDYLDWFSKKKYVSAKLLTYFAEHPVFIFGYGFGDQNVKSILRDIGEIVADENGLISNVYQIIWHDEKIEGVPSDQAVFSFDGREYRTHAIHTNELRWIFEALKSQSALTSINPKLVRALAARMMKLVRHDIPAGSVAVDYDVLERVASENDELPKLLGITSVSNPNQSHPFTLSQVAQRLKMKNWQATNRLFNKIRSEKGIDLRSTDNRYHCKIKTGTKEGSTARKWSSEAIDLLQLVKDGKEYELQI